MNFCERTQYNLVHKINPVLCRPKTLRLHFEKKKQNTTFLFTLCHFLGSDEHGQLHTNSVLLPLDISETESTPQHCLIKNILVGQIQHTEHNVSPYTSSC